MSSKPIIHGRDHRPGGADPIPGIGGGSAAPFAIEWLGEVSFPSGGWPLGAGGLTNADLEFGGFFTSDAAVFEIAAYHDASSGLSNADSYQLYIHEVGTYLVRVGIQCFDTFSHRVASPGTVPISADAGGDNMSTAGTILNGSNIGFGHSITGGTASEWDLTFEKVMVVTSDPGVLVPQFAQASGETLLADTSLYVVQLTTDTMGF